MDPGKRDQLITFERAAVMINEESGGEEPIFASLTQAWARVRYGTGQERREAAQERASQAATFECEWTPTLATVKTNDRINFDGDEWDIVSRSPLSHREIHFAAIRADRETP